MRILVTSRWNGGYQARGEARVGRAPWREPDRTPRLDVAQPSTPPGADFDVGTVVADLAGADTATDGLAGRPDVIFHLAAVVSGEAEEDLEMGYRVNLDGARRLSSTQYG